MISDIKINNYNNHHIQLNSCHHILLNLLSNHLHKTLHIYFTYLNNIHQYIHNNYFLNKIHILISIKICIYNIHHKVKNSHHHILHFLQRFHHHKLFHNLKKYIFFHQNSINKLDYLHQINMHLLIIWMCR